MRKPMEFPGCITPVPDRRHVHDPGAAAVSHAHGASGLAWLPVAPERFERLVSVSVSIGPPPKPQKAQRHEEADSSEVSSEET